jgi:two-component system, sensor histidine kinase
LRRQTRHRENDAPQTQVLALAAAKMECGRTSSRARPQGITTINSSPNSRSSQLRPFGLQWLAAFGVVVGFSLLLSAWNLWTNQASSREAEHIERELRVISESKAGLQRLELAAVALIRPLQEQMLSPDASLNGEEITGADKSLADSLQTAATAAAAAHFADPSIGVFDLEPATREIRNAVHGAMKILTSPHTARLAGDQTLVASHWFEKLNNGSTRLAADLDAAQIRAETRLQELGRTGRERREATAVALLLVAVAAMIYATLLWRRFREQLTQTETLVTELASTQRAANSAALEMKKLSWVAERTGNPVLIIRADGLIEWANRGFETLTGYTIGETIGQRPQALLSDPHGDARGLERLQDCIGGVHEDYGPTDEMVALRGKAGAPLWVQLDVQAVRDSFGSVTHTVVVMTDLSAQKLIETKLQDARDIALSAADARAQFIANTSHEIRTPMNGVLGMSELLLRTDLDDRQRRLAETILRSGKNLLALLNDVLDFSKLESGRFELDMTSTDLGKLLRESTAVFAETAQRKGLSLHLRLPDAPLPIVVADATRIRQVLVNLANNAVKFTSRGEVTLALGLRSLGDGRVTATFTVSDTGIGIPASKHAQIFQAFTQASASTATTYGGTGLGLAISRQLVHLMGGELRVASRVGDGSTFFFELDLAVATTKVFHGGALAPATSLALNVLVAEDFPANQQVIREMLTTLGCQVTLAADGALAVQSFRDASRPFDVVLMDCRMPTMDGFEATRAIRAIEEQRGEAPTPIIAVTAGALLSERKLCQEAGMTAFLAKPVSLDELHATLAQTRKAPIAQALPS